MSKNGSTSSQSSSPLMAPLKSKQPNPEAELSLLELESAIFVSLSMLHTCDVSYPRDQNRSIHGKRPQGEQNMKFTFKLHGQKSYGW